MKKTVAILLSVLMVISSISCIFTVSAETVENLFANGDFAECDTSAVTVEDWFIQGGGYTATVNEGTTENLPEGEEFNFVTFTDNGNTGDSRIYNYQPIKLETNTSYNFSFWIKTNADAKGLKFFLYEPKYIKRDGSLSSCNYASESQNIYTYSYDNGTSTRVAREEIHHLITDSRNGFVRDGASSMASFADTAYPSTDDEWVQVTHTFTTGNDEYHVASIRYEVYLPASCEATEVSIGGFMATAEALDVTVVQGTSSDYDLGTVEPRNGALVEDGKATLIAVPFANNKFLGWYQGSTLVSAAKTFTFEYDSTTKYVAKFEAVDDGVYDSHESYASDLAKFTSGVLDNSGSDGAWVLDSNDGSTWTKVKTNTTISRSGNNSAELACRYAYAGRNFTGLNTDTDYTLTFYSYMEVGIGTNTNDNKVYEFNRQISRVLVTDINADVAWTASEGTTGSAGVLSSTDSSVLAYKSNIYGTGRWEKTEITFNSGNSTEITLWLNFTATTVKGCTTDGCYIDDISLVEEVPEVADWNNTPDLWTVYDCNTTNIGSDGTTAGWVKKTYNTTDGDNIYPGNDGSMYFSSASYQIPSTIIDVEQNTDYVLSFKYKSPDTPKTSSDGVNNYSYHLPHCFVLPINGVPKISSTERGDVITVRAMNYGYINKSTSNDYNYTTSVDTDSPNEWYEFTLDFNSGENSELAFAFKSEVANVYITDMVVVKAADYVPDEDVDVADTDFEDISNWGKHGDGSKQLENYTGHVAAESYVSISTNADYIVDGASSLCIAPQTRWFDYKLEGLKPNTKYILSFSYATNAMQASTGSAQSTILRKYGIFNYAAEDANLDGVTNSTWAASGYLHYIATTLYTIMDEDGEGTATYTNYSVRRVTDGGSNGIKEKANTWYNTVLYFDSGDVSDTLALVLYGNCAKTYLDNFKIIEIADDGLSQEYCAPAVEGKTVYGSYESKAATTTLYEDISSDDFENYKTDLLDVNFAEYSTNAYGSNEFATYTKGNTLVNLTYNPYNSTMLVSEQVIDTLPASSEENVYTDNDLQPLIIQLDHNNKSYGGIGMSYAIRLCDGSFIIIDGGHTETYFDNANRLYNLLREYTPEGKIQIAAWLFTHAHEDHTSGFMSFVERYGAQVNIEQLIFNFATDEQYTAAGGNITKAGYENFEFLYAYMETLTDTKISTCHSGYKYNIRNVVIDVMFTLEDIYPNVVGVDYTDVNDTCSVFKISFTDEDVDQTLLITGDSANKQCAEMLKKYQDDELESTFVQVIHHGISYGSYELYGKMAPEIALWPSSTARMMNCLSQDQNKYFVNEDSVKEIVNSDYGTRVFALPYTAPEGLTGMSKFTLPKEFDASNPLNSYVGVSIRQAGEDGSEAKQALRFKFQIPEHVIKSQTEDGYAVAEYGMMVSESNINLNYYDGSSAFVTDEDGTMLYKAVAYNKADDKNVVFGYEAYENATDDDELLRSTQYTCALYNIGVDKFGKTDYAKYDTTYYVRSYITFKNANGDIKVYYGDTVSASVFAVMQAALKSTNTDDITYVQNFLDGKIDGFTADAEAIKAAWLADETRATLYTPAN